MGLALFSFIAVFLLIGSAGLLLFYRAAMLERLSAVISPRSEADTWLNRLKTKGADRTHTLPPVQYQVLSSWPT